MNRLQKCFAMGFLAIGVWVVNAAPSHAQALPRPGFALVLQVDAYPANHTRGFAMGDVCVAPVKVSMCLVPLNHFGCPQAGAARRPLTTLKLERALLSAKPSARACAAPRNRAAMRAKVIRPVFMVPLV